jgi:transcriptional regulator with XRE-family HTH domain
MKYEFSLDLKVARRRSGLTQADCAYLLGVDPTRISRLEAGKTLPTAVELSVLILIFGESSGQMFQGVAANFGEL